MTGFARLQARVADPTLPPHRRLSCLRSCLEHFAPYGLGSTYMYPTVAAGIPRDLNADPTSWYELSTNSPPPVPAGSPASSR